MSILAVKKPEDKTFGYESRRIAYFFVVSEKPYRGEWRGWYEITEEALPSRDFFSMKGDSEEAFYLIPKEFLVNDA